MANINVTVYDSTENKRVPVELPDDAPCNKIISVLIQKLRLPSNGPDGAPLSYKFHHKNSGRQIQDTQTLAKPRSRMGISCGFNRKSRLVDRCLRYRQTLFPNRWKKT